MPDDLHWDPDSPTKVSCPACEALTPDVTKACLLCRGIGVVSAQARDVWRRAHPTARPVLCPECEGAGGHVEQLGTSYRHRECACCRGATVVPVARAREWRIAHTAGRSNE